MNHKLKTLISQITKATTWDSTLSEIHEDVGEWSSGVTEGFRDAAVDYISDIQGNLDEAKLILPKIADFLEDLLELLEEAGRLEDQMHKDTTIEQEP